MLRRNSATSSGLILTLCHSPDWAVSLVQPLRPRNPQAREIANCTWARMRSALRPSVTRSHTNDFLRAGTDTGHRPTFFGNLIIIDHLYASRLIEMGKGMAAAHKPRPWLRERSVAPVLRGSASANRQATLDAGGIGPDTTEIWDQTLHFKY